MRAWRPKMREEQAGEPVHIADSATLELHVPVDADAGTSMAGMPDMPH